MKARNGNIRSNGKHITPRAEEGYCNEATQSRPLTHSQSHQAHNAAEHTEIKKKKGLDKRGNKRSGLVLNLLQTAFYRKLQENV